MNSAFLHTRCPKKSKGGGVCSLERFRRSLCLDKFVWKATLWQNARHALVHRIGRGKWAGPDQLVGTLEDAWRERGSLFPGHDAEPTVSKQRKGRDNLQQGWRREAILFARRRTPQWNLCVHRLMSVVGEGQHLGCLVQAFRCADIRNLVSLYTILLG